MPSRRALLAGLGGAGLVTAAGGVAASRSAETGRVYLKSVTAEWERDGQRYDADVLTLMYSHESNAIRGGFVAEFDGAYDPPATLRVDSDLHSKLDDEFDSVEYYLTFETNGDISGQVPRSDFNRVGVGDEARVLTYDWLDFGSPNYVLESTDRDPPVDDREVSRYSLDELCSDW